MLSIDINNHNSEIQFTQLLYWCVGRDSVVGIATRYELDGPGIEFRWRRDFSHPSRPPLGTIQTSIKWVRVSFPGLKRPGRGVNHPPSSSAEIKERVELQLYSPFEPSWPLPGANLTFTFYYTAMHIIRSDFVTDIQSNYGTGPTSLTARNSL